MKRHWHIFRWIVSMTRGYRGSILVCCLLGMLKIALGWVFILVSKRAVDIASGDAEGPLVQTLLFLPGIIALELAANATISWLGDMRNVRMDNELKQKLFGHLLRSEWRGIEQFHTGDVMNRLESDVSSIVSFATGTLPNVIILLFELIGSFILLWNLDTTLALIIVCVSPVFIIVAKLYTRRMHEITRQVRDSDAAIQSRMQECLQHRSVIKTLEQTSGTLGRLRSLMDVLFGQVRRRTKLSIYTHSFISCGFSFGYVLTFCWGVIQISRQIIGYGTMTAFLQLAGRVQHPIVDLSRMLPVFVRAFTAAERLCELQALPEEEAEPQPPLTEPIGLRLCGVDFAYPGDDRRRQIFHAFNCDFRPQTYNAILGETGAGKTTLIRLLLALIHPDAGAVELYDAHGAQPLNAASRRYFTYVPQGNTLLSGTIRTNLLLGNPDATEADMWQTLGWAAADFVHRLPLGLDTPCGEGGGGLSEGQAQRVAIARALLRRAPILLLDEATSALDPQTEQVVIDNLLTHVHHKTVIMVTHRPAAAARCEAVVQL
jgi:ABC-type multidrug transport system fused ATPase/permease subunit